MNISQKVYMKFSGVALFNFFSSLSPNELEQISELPSSVGVLISKVFKKGFEAGSKYTVSQMNEILRIGSSN